MGLFDRLSRLARANANALVSAAEDPEKILEQAVLNMQEQLVKLRQAVASSIASLKRLEQQLTAAETNESVWFNRAQAALKYGNEELAREALLRKAQVKATVVALTPQVTQLKANVGKLKNDLSAIESKIAEAKSKKDLLKARAQSAKAQEQVHNALSGINPASALSAFERMEEKVLAQEARAQAAGELAGSDLEQQFAQLESSGGVDDDLALLKSQMSAGALPPANLPAAPSNDNDELKRLIDGLG